jgi:hypothetical protein
MTINNGDTLSSNRGIDLILTRRLPKKKTFSKTFEKELCFFKRKINIFFNFSFDVKNL